jgi:hypothetical protein
MAAPDLTLEEVKKLSTPDLIERMNLLLAELAVRTAKRESDEKTLPDQITPHDWPSYAEAAEVMKPASE